MEIVISQGQRKQYLEHLNTSREEWQVKQADQALRLYQFFLSRVAQHAAPTTDMEKQWEVLEKIWLKYCV